MLTIRINIDDIFLFNLVLSSQICSLISSDCVRLHADLDIKEYIPGLKLDRPIFGKACGDQVDKKSWDDQAIKSIILSYISVESNPRSRQQFSYSSISIRHSTESGY